jgi:threonine/homoserine/homoserine lactone efflux protein
MELNFFLRGLIIGFSIAAPVGPIGVLCIRHTLAYGWTWGLVSGLGAATADAMYGCIAGFGLTFVSSFLIGQQVWLRLVGGAFLCYLGVKTFVSAPAQQPAQSKGSLKTNEIFALVPFPLGWFTEPAGKMAMRGKEIVPAMPLGLVF